MSCERRISRYINEADCKITELHFELSLTRKKSIGGPGKDWTTAPNACSVFVEGRRRKLDEERSKVNMYLFPFIMQWEKYEEIKYYTYSFCNFGFECYLHHSN
jgi:hypothetical protein